MFPRCKVPDAKAATAMRRPSVLTFFALSALGWTVVLTLLWTQVSAWTSYPVAALSHFALEHGAPMWVRTVHKSPGTMEVESSIAMPMPSAGGRLAEALTRLEDVAEREAAQEAAAEVFTGEQLTAIEWTIVLINAFNRVSIASRHRVRLDD